MPVAAHADGIYLGIGVGGSAALQGDIATQFSAEDQTTGRIAVGERWDNLALEGSFFGTDLVDTAGQKYSTQALGLDLKYHVPIMFGFELYVKGGVHAGRIQTDFSNDTRYTGRGYDYGIGLLYAFRLLQVAEAGVWLDLDKDVTTYQSDTRGSDMDSEMRLITVGFSIGTAI